MTSIVSHEGGFNAPCSRVQIVGISPEKTWAKFTKSLIFSNEFAPAYSSIEENFILIIQFIFSKNVFSMTIFFIFSTEPGGERLR